MFGDQEKEWMQLLNSGQLTYYTDFAISIATQKLVKGIEGSDQCPYEAFTVSANGAEQTWCIRVDADQFYQSSERFLRMITQLVNLNLVSVRLSRYNHPINLNPTYSPTNVDYQTVNDLHTILSSLLESSSIYLSSHGQISCKKEQYVPLPALSQFIDCGYRTRGEVEHLEEKERSERALREAANANQTSRCLAYATISIGLLTVLLQWYVSRRDVLPQNTTN